MVLRFSGVLTAFWQGLPFRVLFRGGCSGVFVAFVAGSWFKGAVQRLAYDVAIADIWLKGSWGKGSFFFFSGLSVV